MSQYSNKLIFVLGKPLFTQRREFNIKGRKRNTNLFCIKVLLR